jgi:hypothetical protein
VTLYKQVECLSRELGNIETAAIALANQAEVLSGIPDRRNEARRLADQALAIATQNGYEQLVPGIKCILDSMPSSEV